MFNFKNIKQEKTKFFIVSVFSIVCINFFGSYEFLYLILIITYLIEAEKKKYKNNAVYKNNFDNNARFFIVLASKTKIGSNKTNNFFMQKAGMLSTAGKTAVENPRTMGVLVTIAFVGIAIDGYLTHETNGKIQKHNSQLHEAHIKSADKITAGNLDAQKEYSKAMREYSKNPKGGAPLPPTYIPEPKEPVYLDYRQTVVGQGTSAVSDYFLSKSK